MRITVAVCTWKRAELLDQTLTSLGLLHIPNGIEWEVVAVDNDGTPETAAVLAKHLPHLPMRSEHEPLAGHSRARNRAVQMATGAWILWIDDDVIVDPHWLAAYTAAIATYPDAAYLGGVIEPRWSGALPKGFLEALPQFEGAFALRNFGPDVRPFRAGESPFGANFAVRADWQRRFLYEPRVGRVAGGVLGDDETLVLRAIQQAGGYGVWVGTARLQHDMPATRLSWEFVWRWKAGIGQSSARCDGVLLAPTWFGVPRWAVRRVVTARGRSWLLRQMGDPRWVAAFLQAAQTSGLLRECRERRGQRTATHFVPPLSEVPAS